MKCFLIQCKLFLIIIFSALALNVSQAQNKNFNTDGLYNAELFDYIYRGHFENIEMDREDMEFLIIFNQYLRTYGDQCREYLPPDKKMIMNTVCKTEKIVRNGYGVEIDRYCIEWKKEPSGLYARPDLYDALLELENLQGASALREVMMMITDENIIGESVDKIHKTNALMIDLGRIFSLNSCNSPAIRRFEENLKRFALNRNPIRMKESSKYAVMKETGGPTGEQDLNSLVDDLVTEQARTWILNRYTQGSISGLTVLSEDNQGRPRIIKAYYRYQGFSGDSRGWVKVIFSNGLPEGIYFFDYPNNRKTPGSSIVASYAQGDYRK